MNNDKPILYLSNTIKVNLSVDLCCVPIRMITYNTIISIPICFVLLSSCQENNPVDTTKEILRSDKGGDFRGVHIGDDPTKVIRTENASSVYSMPDELVYRMQPDDDSTWYEISYNFNDQGLYNINMEIYPVNDDKFNVLRKEFIEYYDSRYGACQTYQDYCQWRTLTENGHIVSIQLSHFPTNNARPCLKINFNETQQNE